MEMPQIQIQNPFYFLMKLIGKLLCKKNQLLLQAKGFLHLLFSFTCSYHSLIKLLQKQFLLFKGITLQIAFFSKIKQKRKFYYYCYLRSGHNGAPPQRTIVLICWQNVSKNHEKLERYIHTKVIHALSSPQFLSYHKRSSDPLTRLTRYNIQDKEVRDLLTRSITMTDLKISQAEAH